MHKRVPRLWPYGKNIRFVPGILVAAALGVVAISMQNFSNANGGSLTTAPQCGPANGVLSAVAPSVGLCLVGDASAVVQNGPWSWSCMMSPSMATVACSAPINQALPEGPIGSLQTYISMPIPKGDTTILKYAISNPSQWKMELKNAGIFQIGGLALSSLYESDPTTLQALLTFIKSHGLKLAIGANIVPTQTAKNPQGSFSYINGAYPGPPYSDQVGVGPRYAVDPSTNTRLLVNGSPVFCGQDIPAAAADPIGDAVAAFQALYNLNYQADYVVWDEPFHFANEYWHNAARGQDSYGCQFTPTQVQQMVQTVVQAINTSGYNTNPKLKFGEWEPLSTADSDGDGLSAAQIASNYEMWEPLLTQAQGGQTVAFILADMGWDSRTNSEDPTAVAAFSQWLTSSYGNIPIVANCTSNFNEDASQTWSQEALEGCQVVESAGVIHSLAVWSNWWSKSVSDLFPDSTPYTYTNDEQRYFAARTSPGVVLGVLGGLSGAVVSGWACQVPQAQSPSIPVEVAIYAGDPSDGGVLLANQYATLPSAPFQNSRCHSTIGGFAITISPADMSKYAGKRLYAVAGNSQTLVSGSGTMVLPSSQ